jgi:hypothetical protein
MSISVGSHVGPYEILAAIGAGGMSEVFRARVLTVTWLGRTAGDTPHQPMFGRRGPCNIPSHQALASDPARIWRWQASHLFSGVVAGA